MIRIASIVPVLAGAAAGAVVAISVGTGGSTKTVTEVASAGTPTVASVSTSAAQGSSIPTSLGGTANASTINAIYRKDSPGVVDIMVTAQSNGGLLGTEQTSEDEGAGVVYDKQGDIVTDEHVVANATSIKVTFQNGVTARAKLIGKDASQDVAVIRVDVPASELHPIPFANSDEAQVGDPVVAIGSPFGLPETTTAGIVSAVGRSITAPNGYTIPGAIQTDAAINPGNSGGPLLDASGEVIGLNDQINTTSGDSAGVGFATPGNTDMREANEMISGKPVQHAYVGICLNQAGAGAQIATSGGGSCQTGPVVAGSPAAKAGLRAGDKITSVDGLSVASSNDFIEILANDKPGQTVTMTVSGPGGTRTVKVTLGNRPASTATAG